MRLMTDTVRALNQSTFGNTTWIGDDRFIHSFVLSSLLFPSYLSSSHIFQLLVQVHQTDGQTVGRSLLLFFFVTRRSRAPNEIDTTHHGETRINQTLRYLIHAQNNSLLFRFSSSNDCYADNDISTCC